VFQRSPGSAHLLSTFTVTLYKPISVGRVVLRWSRQHRLRLGVWCLTAVAHRTCRDPQKIPSVFFLQ
jgi:hypothetical protein